MAKKQKETQQIQQDAANYQELQEKYDEALKLLGAKELENQILKDLVKKKYPDYKPR